MMEMDTTKQRAVAAWRGAKPGDFADTAGATTSASEMALRLGLSENAAAWRGALLRESNHRIANSLQIIASMLKLQARSGQDDVRVTLSAVAAQIQAVACVHKALQGGGGAAGVDLAQTLRETCAALHRMSGEPNRLALIFAGGTIAVSAEASRLIGMIVTELVLNAFRHAFPDGRIGVVGVGLSQTDGHLVVAVLDDGVGHPSDQVSHRSLGLSLVRTAVRRLRGSLRIERKGGTRCVITLPLLLEVKTKESFAGETGASITPQLQWRDVDAG